jgi:hypothetical protein
MPLTVDLASLDFASLVRSGDLACWGQAAAEPLPLTRSFCHCHQRYERSRRRIQASKIVSTRGV